MKSKHCFIKLIKKLKWTPSFRKRHWPTAHVIEVQYTRKKLETRFKSQLKWPRTSCEMDGWPKMAKREIPVWQLTCLGQQLTAEWLPLLFWSSSTSTWMAFLSGFLLMVLFHGGHPWQNIAFILYLVLDPYFQHYHAMSSTTSKDIVLCFIILVATF